MRLLQGPNRNADGFPDGAYAAMKRSVLTEGFVLVIWRD